MNNFWAFLDNRRKKNHVERSEITVHYILNMYSINNVYIVYSCRPNDFCILAI